jgi:hypothetical protein
VAIVLRGIERGAGHQTPGFEDGDASYLALVRRVLQERPGVRPEPATSPAETPAEPRIVITD